MPETESVRTTPDLPNILAHLAAWMEAEHVCDELPTPELRDTPKFLRGVAEEVAIGRARNQWLEDEVHRLGLLVQELGVVRDDLFRNPPPLDHIHACVQRWPHYHYPEGFHAHISHRDSSA